MTRPSSLAARILLLAVGLVTLTAVIAGLATIQFARTSARAEQRGELNAQASLLTLQSARLVRPAALARVAANLDGTTATVYDTDGTLVGSTFTGTRPALIRQTRSIVTKALLGQAVHAQVRVRGVDMLIEARATTDGGAFVLSRRLTTFTKNATTLAASILATLGGCLLLAVLAAILLARRITKPLAATAAAARRLAQGERQVEVPDASPPEVADVGDALRTLDAALVTSEGRQREFLLSISHELRTPLTALRGYGEALADGIVPPDRIREIGGTLVAETTRVDRFVGDLLELARLEAEDFTITPTVLDLGDIARETVDAWQGRAATLDVALLVDGFDARVPARADARRVRQVLDGLVENALRATPAGGSVALRAASTPERAAIAVEDSGPGLSDDDLEDAFTRGLLQERYRESRAVGTGLGLSIATRLAVRMQGRVVAGHATPPPGARFTLELPHP